MRRWMLCSAGLAMLLLMAGCGRAPVAEGPTADPTSAAPAALPATAPPPQPTAPPAATASPQPAGVDVPAPAVSPSARATAAPTGAPAPAPTLAILAATAAPTAARPAPPVAKFVALAARDLAGRLGLAADQIVTLSADAITWPDAALGCPRPGKVYQKGRVPGFKIVLEAQSQQYTYHTDHVGQIVLCPNEFPDAFEPGLPAEPGSGGESPSTLERRFACGERRVGAG